MKVAFVKNKLMKLNHAGFAYGLALPLKKKVTVVREELPVNFVATEEVPEPEPVLVDKVMDGKLTVINDKLVYATEEGDVIPCTEHRLGEWNGTLLANVRRRRRRAANKKQ